MSKTVDERVVEMRFDNRNFENNVRTSMSTLDKLKEKLNLTGASKGIENLNTAANKVNMTGLGSAVETVHAKFSALEIMGVTALANITNSAVNAGKKIASALTIEPVKTGFQEYETQINAVQTILANTQSKGSTITDVNKALDELNKYADKTIYNFTEMTRNIGTFTAAGVDLDKSVTSIKGIANLAAVSGSTSQQASTAMYQLSQALAAGKVQLMDWNSVVNAGMGGQVFQDALKRTATNMGHNVDAMIKKYGSFRESLTKGEWLTAEVLTETLSQLSGAYNKADLIAQGYTEKQAQEILDLAETAENAATKVKTFTQLWDVLKESAQSGWTQTWELLLGDFEEAKSLFTPIADFLTGIINNMSEARNKLLEGALASPFGKLAEKLEKVTGATEKMKNVTKDYSDIVDKVIGGEFGTGQSRWDKLAKAGYDWAKVQNMVNEKLGNTTRHTEQLTEAQKNQNGTQATSIDQLVKMSDAQLKSLGFTKSEISAFRDLQEQSEKTGIPINKLIKDLDQLEGRTLLINSFKNAGKGLVKVFKAISNAWKKTFWGDASEDDILQEKTERIYDMITALHKFSTKLIANKDTVNKLTRTFQGLFAILDIITTITGGAFKIAFKLVSAILDRFDMNILDVTANIGDAIVKFRDWIDATLDFSKVIDKIAPYLNILTDGIRNWVNGLKETDNISQYIIQGLVNGLVNGSKVVINAIMELGKGILDGIKGVLGIHSPSVEFFEIGKNIIQGLVNGVKEGSSEVYEALKNIGSKCIEIFKQIDFGKVLAAVLGIGMFVTMYKTVNKITDTIETCVSALAAPLEGIKNMLDGVGEMFSGLGEKFKAQALERKSRAILNIAIAIGILAVSMKLLTTLSWPDLGKAVVAMLALAAIIGVLGFAAGKMNEVGDFGKQSFAIVAITTSLLVLAIAMRQLAKIKADQMETVITALVFMIAGLAGILIVFGKFIKAGSADSMNKAGAMLFKMSLTLLIMVFVMKQIAKLEPDDITKGLITIAAFEVLIAGIIAVSKMAGQYATKAGSMLLLMSGAFLIMIGIIKLISLLSAAEILKGVVTMGLMELLFAGVIAVSKLAGQNGAKAGVMLLLMSGALAITVGVIKQIGKLDGSVIKKGIGVIAILEVLFAAVIAASHLAGKNAIKAGIMLLSMSVALLIVVGILFIIQQMNPEGLGRALGIVAVLETLFAGLIVATHLAGDCKATLIVMSVAIALLVGSLILLTFIDSSKLLKATASLAMVLVSLAAVFAATGQLKGVKITSLLGMVVVVSTLAGIILLLAQLDCGSAMGAVASLSVLLIAMSASMIILGHAGTVSAGALLGLAAMGLIVAELAAILGLMSHLDVKTSIQHVACLSTLLIVMSACMAILGHAGIVSFAAVGALACIGLIVAGLAAILGAMSYFNIEVSLKNVISLSILLLAMSGAVAILGMIGPMATAAYPAMGALAVLILGLGALLVGLGALNEKWEDFDKFLTSGIPILSKIGEALGSFVGSIVSGIGVGLTSGLPAMADNLSDFMDRLQPFIEGSKNIDATSVKAVMSIAKMMLIITAADLIESVLSGITGVSSMTDFAEKLEPFGDAIIRFSKKVSGKIDKGAVTAAANAGLIMAKMAKAIPKSGGLMQDILGETDMGAFATQLEAFGDAIIRFSKKVSKDGAINKKAVQAAADAGSILVELNKSIPASGGLLQTIIGHSDLSTFATNMEAYGDGIIRFSKKVSCKGAIDKKAIQGAADAGAIMVKLQETVPKSGGLISYITGHNDLTTFGNNLVEFGKAVCEFSNTIVNNGGIDKGAVTAAAYAGTIMSTLQRSLPEDGGWFSDKTTLGDFGNQLVEFGKDIASYADKIKDVKANKLATVSEAVKVIVNTIKRMVDIDTSGVDTFKEAIEKLSKINFNTLVKNFSESSKKMSKTGADIMLSIAKGMKSKQSTLKNQLTSIINDMGKSVITSKLVLYVAGVSVISKFAEGISKSKNLPKIALLTMLSTAITSIKECYDSFYNAGSYLVTGFANGISENDYKAVAKAKAMAKAAKKAAEKALGIASPSKVFYKIGKFTGQGFVNALGDYVDKAYNAGTNMADSARSGLSKTIGNITSIIDSDIDIQPTIRPVIDLSDVESGAGAINSMFGQRLAIGASVNAGAISSMMNTNSQNGNDDVVSAINKLRKDLGNINNTSITIDGITYDDGSNITSAVESLVRAAKVERRI